MQYTKLFVILFGLFFATSCVSLHEPREVYEPLDYTVEDIRQSELHQIEKFAADYPVKALWRALIMQDPETIDKYTANLIDLAQKAIDNGDYFLASKYCTTLTTTVVDKPKAAEVESLLAQIQQHEAVDTKDSIPGLSLSDDEKSLLPKTLADCINSTVTVWVDRGIKIERGAGYADRIIGSGFFIDKRGYIVTNNHVIADLVDPKSEKYSKLFVKLARDNETRIPARVIGHDKTLDLALLKVEVDPPFILQLGERSDLTIGEHVNAIGTPLGLHGTITSGIISAVDRKLFTTGSVLQLDAAVNSGNSGGPCIDDSFRVQAIVFAGIQSYQGLNFAIPVEYLRQDLPYLFHGGKRLHAWVSSYGHTKREGLSELGLELQYAMSGGITSRAGLQKGDVITFAAGQRVTSLEDMQNILRTYTNETIIPVTYLRDGESKNALLYLDERPEYPSFEAYTHDLVATSFLPIFGMSMTSISSVSFIHKYVIDDIITGSVADESGFSVNDVVNILEVKFSEDNKYIGANISTRKRKGGYIDVTVGIGAETDSPYYF